MEELGNSNVVRGSLRIEVDFPMWVIKDHQDMTEALEPMRRMCKETSKDCVNHSL